MSKARFNPTASQGVYKVGMIFQGFGWIFRQQLEQDMGIDAHVEICEDRNPSGRLIGLQIKSGESYFRHRNQDGIKFGSALM
ncbi:DUF4365 domain-containing protein [Thermoleptolyngbya sp. C42_A2020_037]|uniref:DUF4365 domain-containing protein n=1 Tax=Thermoleptolyngbya sp. C42_A2020_037 TaxID=2747799 RepID=UPI0019F18FBE|nr:DUF4365 domain-containing protein [Thermoleptolyngbya sp. C42_A2020_037]MBF2083613.1 DUF4365 domain-containing protein [Thermoleptolyngbya sp. C42_A2020_037]